MVCHANLRSLGRGYQINNLNDKSRNNYVVSNQWRIKDPVANQAIIQVHFLLACKGFIPFLKFVATGRNIIVRISFLYSSVQNLVNHSVTQHLRSEVLFPHALLMYQLEAGYSIPVFFYKSIPHFMKSSKVEGGTQFIIIN